MRKLQIAIWAAALVATGSLQAQQRGTLAFGGAVLNQDGVLAGEMAQMSQPQALGTARSMGSFLLMAGEPGTRAALPNASILIHQPLGGFQGQASDMLIHAEEILKTKQRMTRLYAEHCGRSYEAFEQAMDRDRFMTAEEALEWGLIDRILTERDINDALETEA